MRVEICFNICRICLQNTDDDMCSIYEPINERGNDSNEMLFQRIARCGGIEVLKNPELPNKICRKCNILLNIAHKFRTICKSSDEYLRQFVSNTAFLDLSDKDADNSNDYADGIAEYLLEYNNQDTASASVAQVLQQAGHDIDETKINFEYEEIDEYTDICPNGNDDDDDDEYRPAGSVLKSAQIDIVNSSKIPRRSLRIPKTLDISSDGTAVIRLKSERMVKVDKDVHICDVCGNTYNRKYALDAHMRRHRNEKPFECEICQKSFHLNFQLTRHIRKHTGARPYVCQYCKRNFSDRSTMVKHERIHRNERPYKCDACGKSFTYSNVLKVHMLTHTGEKPFTCGICDKRFSRGHHLRAHLETLQHQSDPRSKILLKQIKREVDNLGGEIDGE